MNGNLILTKESVPADIERYFRGVLALDQQDKVFSVNLDDVWQVAYSERGKAVKALKQNFIDNVDFISIAQSGKTATGGFKKIDYYLTSACLEYFIARKVRPVFEVYRRVFHHAVAQVQQQPSLQEQIQANLTFADWAIKTLNINEASKLGWAKKISDKFGLAAELPDAVNAGTGNPVLHPASDLLVKHNVGISARAFNKILEIKGVVKQAERKCKNGKLAHWMVLQPAFDKYGQNTQHKDHQLQTQIEWYDNLFPELLTIVGLNSQTSLNLN